MIVSVTTFTEVGSSPCLEVDVTGLLAIADSFSICFVLFSHTPGFHSLITCCVFNPLFPPCVCVVLFVVSACAHVDWCASGFVPKLLFS